MTKTRCDQMEEFGKNRHTSSPELVPQYAASAVVVLGFLWAFVGLAVVSVSQHVPDATSRYCTQLICPCTVCFCTHTMYLLYTCMLCVIHITIPTSSRLLYYVFALASIMVGMLSTHGLGGRLRHGAHMVSQGIHARRRSSRSASTSDASRATSDDLAPSSDAADEDAPMSPTHQGLGWSFFQPFSGGTLFIATQGVGWAFFAACILLCGWGMYAALKGVAHCVSCWVFATGFSMFSAQLAVGASVFLFKGGASATRKVWFTLDILVVIWELGWHSECCVHPSCPSNRIMPRIC